MLSDKKWPYCHPSLVHSAPDIFRKLLKNLRDSMILLYIYRVDISGNMPLCLSQKSLFLRKSTFLRGALKGDRPCFKKIFDFFQQKRPKNEPILHCATLPLPPPSTT